MDVVRLQEVRQKKEYARSKFVERGGKDWRQSKFVYVISAIDAFLHDINKFLELTSEVLGHIRQNLVYLQETEVFYVASSSVCLKLHDRFVPLIEENAHSDQNEDTRKIKQRSQRWHDIRNRAFITGSTLYRSIGLDGLKRQRQHFDKVICGIPEPEPSIEQKRAMEHGTINESNGVATLVGRILPVIEPTLEFHEEGCVCIKEDEKTIMVVSPDGSLYTTGTDKIIAGVEIKCPVSKVHLSVPERYYLQCLSEIEALGVEYLYYICWTPEVTSIFKIEKDTAIFETAIQIAKEIYVVERKRPTKIKEATKALKKDIKKKIASIKILGEYPSIVATENCEINRCRTEITHNQREQIVVGDIRSLLENLVLEANESYELLRQKATEAMVFLCCDLDRAWSVEKVRWSPVCWFPKGYSLTTETVRKIMEKVLDECKAAGIHVPACSFDGQWHNIAVRTCTRNPLTVLQLQKDVWVEVQKMPKSSIEKELKSIKVKPQWSKVDNSFEVYSARPRLPKTSTRGWAKKQKGKNTKDISEKEILKEGTSLLEVLPEEVVEASGSSFTLLSCNFDQSVVEEIVNCNTDEKIWADALLDVIDQVDDFDDNEEREDLAIDMIDNFCKKHNEISENISNEENKNVKLCRQDYDRILGMLKTDKNANETKKWDLESVQSVENMLSCQQTLQNTQDVDLRVVVRYLKQCKNIVIKEYATKTIKITELVKHLGLNDKIDIRNKHIKATRNKSKEVKSLSMLAASALKSVPKNVLNISYAEYIWPDRFEQWQKNSPTFGIDVIGFENPEYFFYIPEYSSTRQQLEVRSIDSTHLFTRTRRKTCKGGIEGISNAPWLKVARQGKTLLTPAMVEEIVDPMSMGMANTHFSKAVQSAMEENCDFRAATLCADIHDWWRGEDEAGISATERMTMRFKLRRRLLSLINFGEFPPPGQYVNGWPTQLFEALLANIDAKLLLYSPCRSGTYNSRAFSSMMGETFFSEMTHQDRAGHGTISCDDFSRYIGKTTEQLQARLDTSRKFVYRTSSKVKAYYPVSSDMDLEDLRLNDYTKESLHSDSFHIHHIKLKDHFFDSEERRRRAGTRRQCTVATNRNALHKGALGVRWYHARRDDSKLLRTTKLGI